jgi:hypothetical protein
MPMRETRALADRMQAVPTPALIIASALFIYGLVFIYPAIPIYMESDSLIYIYDAGRMASGDHIYKDFFQFTFPGSPTVYALLMDVFGQRYWLLPAAIIGIGTLSAALMTDLAKRLVPSSLAYIPPLLFIFLGFRYYGLDGTHRMFSPIFILVALCILVRRQTSWAMAAAGAACAFASFFTQHRGVGALAAIGLWILLDSLHGDEGLRTFLVRGTILVSSFVLVLLGLCAYFMVTAGFETFWWSTIVYSTLYYPTIDKNNLAQLAIDLRTALHPTAIQEVIAAIPALFYGLILPAVVLGGTLFVWWRGRRDWDRWRYAVLVGLTAAVLILTTVGPCPVRFFQVCEPALVFFAVLLACIPAVGKYRRPGMAALVVVLGLLAASQVWRTQRHWRYDIFSTPSGELAIYSGPLSDRYAWLLQNTSGGDYVYEVRAAYVYFPLQLKNPTRFPHFLETDYTRPEYVAEAVQSLEQKQPRFILWEAWYSKPAAERAPSDHLGPLYDYLLEHYQKVPSAAWTLPPESDIEVWERVR